MVNKADCRAVPEFSFPRNPKLVYTCRHMHCHEYGISPKDRLHICFSHVCFISIFEI